MRNHVFMSWRRLLTAGLVCLASLAGLEAFQSKTPWPPAVRTGPDKSPALSAE